MPGARLVALVTWRSLASSRQTVFDVRCIERDVFNSHCRHLTLRPGCGRSQGRAGARGVAGTSGSALQLEDAAGGNMNRNVLLCFLSTVFNNVGFSIWGNTLGPPCSGALRRQTSPEHGGRHREARPHARPLKSCLESPWNRGRGPDVSRSGGGPWCTLFSRP